MTLDRAPGVAKRAKRNFIMSPWTEENLCRFVHEHAGIILMDHQLPSLRKTVSEACIKFGLASGDDFVAHLQKAHSSPELEFLIAGVTVGETYFFRHEQQISFLRDQLLPQTIAEKRRRGDRTLRLWSAGCATGEEVYTLAILVSEALPADEEWQVHLLGTDINVQVLAKAVRGHYRKWSFRATPAHLWDRYFETAGNEFAVRPKLRAMARFAYLNLATDQYPSILSETTNLDLILCRNVFIYFSQKSVRMALKKIAASLVPGGTLLTGACDLVNAVPKDLPFSLHRTADVFYLTRTGGTPPAQDPPSPQPRTAPPETVRPVAPIRARSTPKSATTTPEATPRAGHIGGSESRDRYAPIIELLRKERWQQAWEAVNAVIETDGETALLLQFKAKTLANLGDLPAALALCERSLELNRGDARSHFLTALVLSGMDRLKESEAALRKVLYLDRSWAEAHFHLGLLQLRNGHREKGLKHLENAKTIAEQRDPEQEVHDAAGMTFGRLADILKNEISIYSSAKQVRSP